MTRSASVSNSPIASMWREVSSTSAPAPIVWPVRLVPAPRVTTGTSSAPASAIAAATSSASRGNATASGSRAYMLASDAYRWRVYASSRTSPAICAPEPRNQSLHESDVYPLEPVGRHFLQIPGPTNVPDRVLRAIDNPTIDHRGPAFAALGHEVLDGLPARVPHRRARS